MASCVALVVLQLLLTSLTLSTAVIVRIDADNGTNTSDCITGNHSCRTLQYAVTNSYNDDTTFLLLSDLTLLSTVNFTSRHNITITGAAGQPKQLICNCSYSQQIPCGLMFENITNLTLENIAVKHCGIPMNVTTEGEDIIIRGGVIIKNGAGNTSLVHYTATENNGYGTIILNTGGTVLIYNSSFCYNTITTSEITTEIGGGGLAIIASCSHTESCLPSGSSYSISKSRFCYNRIEWRENSFSFLELAYGGGLNVAFNVNTTDNKLLISDSTFNDNSALYGGGMFIGINSTQSFVMIQNSFLNNNNAEKGSGLFITCENTCNNNTVNINSSQFKNNKVIKKQTKSNYQGGGGIAIFIGGNLQFGLPVDNYFSLHNCTFTSNKARFGGGTYVYCGQQQSSKIDNEVHFINCSWKENLAAVSPAVDVSSGYLFAAQTKYTIVNVTFTDCIFINNIVSPFVIDNATDSLYMRQYTGTFLSMQVPVNFSGNTIFTNNNGTALLVSSSVVTFLEGSNVLFHNNTGVFGGAITLMGFSLLQYQDNTIFNFVSNNATLGGAIHVRSYDQHLSFNSRTCFLFFWTLDSKPNNVSFNFYNNSASTGVGNAIYMTSVKACLKSCELILHSKKLNTNDIFVNDSCLGNFTFIAPAQFFNISTEGSEVTYRNKTIMLEMTPGMDYQLPLDVLDDFGDNVTNVTVYTAQLADSCSSHDVSIDPAFTNVASNTIRILGMPTTTCDLVLTIHGSQMIQVSVQFNLTWCHPGYVLNNLPDKQHLSSCVCSAHTTLPNRHYNGIDYCNSTTSAAIINPGIWVGYDTDNDNPPTQDNLYTAPCPTAYCNSTLLELNMSAESLKEYMCEANRQGFLCGECQNATVFFNSFYPACQEDHNCALGPLFYIVYEILPISIVFIVIILADISLTSGVACNAIFLAQIFNTINFLANGAGQFKPFYYIDFVYGIVDLDFNFPFCFWSGASALQIKAMKYVSLLYAMGLVVVTITVVNHCNCARLSRRLCRRTRQTSIVQGIIAFLVICYSQCANNSFKILTMARVSSIGDIEVKRVVYYAGSISYFSLEHLPYAIPAVFILIVVVIPLPLVLFFDPFLLKIEGLLVQHHLLRSCLPWTQFRMKFKPFLDSFQGCFRDDARYFAGLFFVYRVVIYVTSMMVKNTVEFNILLEAILIVMLTIQATVQPFEKKFDNIISCFVFAVLLLMNTLTVSVYLLDQAKGVSNELLVIYWVQFMLCCVPVVVGLGMCAKWFVIKIKNRKQTSVTNAINEESLLIDRNVSGSYSQMKDRAGLSI